MDVNIRCVRLVPFSLPLRHTVSTARGPAMTREGCALTIAGDNGLQGCGEATPLHGFGTETLAACVDSLSTLARFLLGKDIGELDALLDQIEALAPHAPAARAAVDLALHDLAARVAGQRVAAHLLHRYGSPQAETRQWLEISAVLSAGDLDSCVAQADRVLARGIGVVKLKLGRQAVEREVELVQRLSARLGGALRLRLDANGSWTGAEAERVLEGLLGLPVEWLEQPVAAPDFGEMRRLRRLQLCPIAADESADSEASVRRLGEMGAADWVIIKPAAVGGLRTAWRMAAAARAVGLGVAVTSFMDSSLGMRGALHLAAALPGPLPASGLDTGSLFASDLAEPLPIMGSEVQLDPGPGLGVGYDAERLARARTGPVVDCAL